MKKKKRKKIALNKIKILIFLFILIIVFSYAVNYEKSNENTGRVNIIIDNVYETENLENDIYINEKNVVYMSIDDVKKYFDKNISLDEENNQVITSYGEKTAKLPLDKNLIIVNDSYDIDVLSGAIKKENVSYIPIISMEKIYELDIEYLNNERILLIDSLTKKLIKADVAKKCEVKYKPTNFSGTVDTLKKADKVVIIETIDNKWTKIRTKNGKIGYVKTKLLQNEIYIREDVGI